MRYIALHIPTATKFEIPLAYCSDYSCIEVYLTVYAWTHCIKSVDNRTRMAWLHSSIADRESMFKYRAYEFDILEED